ncbi:MAG: GNAT family N-acetyltransferase [Pandoraea sp.]|nr:GNAT family N-acetyltransferase [Pandoraea sp. NE5]MBN9115079.1 GNAT family N-acetyltransferase [Pandoraea sp.]
MPRAPQTPFHPLLPQDTETIEFRIRPMQSCDIPQVLTVQAAAYVGPMRESEATLASRHALSPSTCWVAEGTGPTDTSVVGYLLTHPWRMAAPPPLDTILKALPDAADCWYVHDMALLPRTRGAGVACQLYAAALAVARSSGLRASALVAVQQSQGFWARFGYAATSDASPQMAAKLAAKLAGYGDGAMFMTRTL